MGWDGMGWSGPIRRLLRSMHEACKLAGIIAFVLSPLTERLSKRYEVEVKDWRMEIESGI